MRMRPGTASRRDSHRALLRERSNATRSLRGGRRIPGSAGKLKRLGAFRVLSQQTFHVVLSRRRAARPGTQGLP